MFLRRLHSTGPSPCPHKLYYVEYSIYTVSPTHFKLSNHGTYPQGSFSTAGRAEEPLTSLPCHALAKTMIRHAIYIQPPRGQSAMHLRFRGHSLCNLQFPKTT